MKRNTGKRYAVGSPIRLKANSLRSSGMSIPKIARQLGISKDTAFRWLRDVQLTDEQRSALRKNSNGFSRLGILSHERSMVLSKKWIAEAEFDWDRLCKIPLFVMGIGLYWGEGSKAMRALQISNSDPNIIRIWRRWTDMMLPNESKFRVTILAHDDVDRERAIKYWSYITGVKEIKVYRCKPRSSTGKMPRRRLPYGTVHIMLCKGAVEWHTKMMTWIKLASRMKNE